jgi:hypothetical protein
MMISPAQDAPDVTAARDAAEAHRAFVLRYVQPGLAGLIDGSVSTLAPIFAAAFATHSNGATFLVGIAASIGAGISMGFTEALSDDGQITGRGTPWMRGLVCGVMTTVGGLGHTLPYAIPATWPNAFGVATALAILVVVVELLAIDRRIRGPRLDPRPRLGRCGARNPDHRPRIGG